MHPVWILCGVIATIYALLKHYLKSTVWCRSKTCLVGKTAVVTGANTGIGYETALDFAKRGARVILACRDQQKADAAKTRIVQETGNGDIVVKIVDFASFDSVRAFAQNVKETEQRLDILVNNAGASGIPDKKSKDGLNLLMQVNYFSSFLLTNLLIDLLKKSEPSRVVNVSSLAAKYARFDLEDLNRFTGMHTDYANSKLCNVLFTMELAEKLQGTRVTTFSLHPGVVDTEIFRRIKGQHKAVFEFFRDHFFRTSEEGAQTTIYCSVERNIEDLSGEHFDNCERVEPYKTSQVKGLAKKLWEKSEKFVELKPEEVHF
ncbi:dehydrogenase/reductase SDR family member 13 [Tribolium castaneum]|uniref:WW domain-containing oxidoreductase-like Protein n=1 Tax=Tribolium castaneum TaxID=7070 RepID=D6X0B3_TRICA|nr:PREDICTED: dehydrogenase/reductase SDR family member 13 [Tribolium castaneum]EFA10520.1 WW domain-containing oxidoreductase-like Protein [Tribolium castaneum]|eukprot:XP_967535.1 PREDICTED: dehydrogenase/reductase SDR family member 13 [Tribolium castaneum]